MAPTPKVKRLPLRSSFSFGAVSAEHDSLLKEAFWDNGDYEVLASEANERCIVIGRTGSGKSAIIQYLKTNHDKIIEIVPENLSLMYLTNVNVITHLLSLGVHLDPFLRALWKHIFLVEILRFRYNMDSAEVKQSIWGQLKQRFSGNSARQRAMEYLDEFGDKFWCPTDERVRQIIDRFEEKIKGSAEGRLGTSQIGATGNYNSELTEGGEVKVETAERYQKIVNETQVPRLNAMMEILDTEILKNYPQIHIVIDDLDKDWVQSDILALMIRCLLDTVADMKRVKGVKILVAVRTNLFEYLGYGNHPQTGQEEKIRGLSQEIRWTEQELRSLLDLRAQAAAKAVGRYDISSVMDMLPRPNKNAGDPLKHILDRTMMRPRDAIQFLNVSVREAAGKSQINWENINRAEKEYSVQRLNALRDEWSIPYQGLDKVTAVFKRGPVRFTKDELLHRLDDVALLVSDPAFVGTDWVNTMFQGVWGAGSGQQPWNVIYGPIIEVLYKISFIGVSRSAQGNAVFSYERDAPMRVAETLNDSCTYVIHPAFHQALELT